jgi:hypothetical protein
MSRAGSGACATITQSSVRAWRHFVRMPEWACPPPALQAETLQPNRNTRRANLVAKIR